MTAVDTARDAGSGGHGADGAAAPSPDGPGPRRGIITHTRVAVAFVVVVVLVGMAIGFFSALAASGRYQSTATVVFTAVDSGSDVSAASRSIQNDRIASWAQVASSQVVPQRAAAHRPSPGGVPFDPAGVAISARVLSGTEAVQLTVASDNRSSVGGEATQAAQALVDVVVASERFPGLPQSRVAGEVVTPGTAAVDHGAHEGQWWAVLGGIAGFLLALGVCSVLRAGPWVRDVAPQPVRNRRRAVELNATVMGDELHNFVASLRTPVGKVTAIAVVLAIAGYGVTGNFFFPVLLVLAAGVWGCRTRDPRWSAAALLFTGIGVFPEKVDLVKLGPVTPTVLEFALVVAFLLTVRAGWRPPRAAFTAPVLAIVVAVVVGSVVALALGGSFSLMIDNSRAILMVLGFFPVYWAFARRPHQLVATLLSIAGVCSAVVIVASYAGWTRLLVDQRSSVITGSSTDNVSRLSSPVLNLWAPLLILLLSALLPRRPRWLWIVLVVIGVAHEALSFNRSTWAPLILLIIAVAAVTHGSRGVVRRLLGITAVGVLGLALAFGGVLGAEGKAIAERASSVVTGQAYGEDSLPDRLRENGAALRTLGESPWIGVGVGQYYGGEIPTYDSEHSRAVITERPYIHNQYLRIWLYMGVLGLLAYGFAGVRILAVTVAAWRRRAAGAPMVVAVAMGLACYAALSSLQTTLVERPAILATVALMAAAAGFATWAPWASTPAQAPPRAPAPLVPAQTGAPQRPEGPAVAEGPTRPASRAGTLEE